MHNNQMVTGLKDPNGITLREKNVNTRSDVYTAEVFLPYNTHYSIFLKNLNMRHRAVVFVSIDGCGIGGSLLVEPDSSINLERFLDESKKFLFIEQNRETEAFHGKSQQDGKINISYQYETEPIHAWEINSWTTYSNELFNPLKDSHPMVPFVQQYRHDLKPISTCLPPQHEYYVHADISNSHDRIEKSSGITVAGGESSQEFNEKEHRELESKIHKITYKIFGASNSINVTDKIRCVGCNRMVTPDCNYCPKCGTALIKIRR